LAVSTASSADLLARLMGNAPLLAQIITRQTIRRR
jgi:hypothetical protein